LPSDREFVSEIETYAPLKFEEIKFIEQLDAGSSYRYRRLVKGSAQLKFNFLRGRGGAISPTSYPDRGGVAYMDSPS
jgi:hypothetical protein